MVEYTNIAEGNQSNRNRIYQLVYQQGAISKPDISNQLGISLPTTLQNVKNLQNDGLLQEGDTLESTGGRKAIAVTCVRNARYSIGIDITLNHIHIVIINLMSEIIDSIRIQKIFSNSAQYYTELGRLTDDLVSKNAIHPDLILGVGFSVPGVITADGQLLLHSHVLNISGMQCNQLKRYIPYEGILCNDANAAGYAEIWTDHRNSTALYLALSNSVGGAIIFANTLYQGENQHAGEFGHMTLVRDGLPCYCGRKGCVDSYLSAQLLSKHTGDDLALFFNKLKDGDASITHIWSQYMEWLAITVNNLAVAFDCRIILGGYLGSFLEDYLEDLRSMVADITTFDENSVPLSICKYKQDAAAVGAALLFVKPFINQI